MAQEPKQDRGGTYEIRVRGALGGEWSAWFDGLSIRPEPDGDTLIVGPIQDQAALHGILAKLRDLGLPIVSVRRSIVRDEAEADE